LFIVEQKEYGIHFYYQHNTINADLCDPKVALIVYEESLSGNGTSLLSKEVAQNLHITLFERVSERSICAIEMDRLHRYLI